MCLHLLNSSVFMVDRHGENMEQDNEKNAREIGYHIPHSTEELEEDILEYLYTTWSAGRQVSAVEICNAFTITGRELRAIRKQMLSHGYLIEDVKDDILRLTEIGKIQGEECHTRHHNLAQFLQMTCGLEEEQAQKNACRMEHVVDSEVIDGVRDFLKYGDTYDRIARKLDLHSLYEEGSYTFCLSMYRLETRYPRRLAEEFALFHDQIELVVKKEQSMFYLQTKEQENPFYLWFLNGEQWTMAEKQEKGYPIPAEIFVYGFSNMIPVTECECLIGITKKAVPPSEEECRELNIHIW